MMLCTNLQGSTGMIALILNNLDCSNLAPKYFILPKVNLILCLFI